MGNPDQVKDVADPGEAARDSGAVAEPDEPADSDESAEPEPDPGEPAAPSNPLVLNADKSPTGRPVLLWDKSPDEDVSSYVVRTESTTRVQSTVSGRTWFELTHLDAGRTYDFEVSAIRDGVESTAARTAESYFATPPPDSGRWAATSFAVAIASTLVALILGIVWLILEISDRSSGTRNEISYYAIASGVIATVLMILHAVATDKHGPARRGFGIWRPLIGFDGRIGTSKVQIALWTLLIAFILGYLSAKSLIGGGEDPFKWFDSEEDAWSDYLILLGGPFASLVFAKGVVTYKVEGETLQKTVEDNGIANLKQTFENDTGGTDLVDTQYLVFNLVALVFVIIGFASSQTLPEVPPLLLALTGTGAATYVLNKAVQQNPPRVTAVHPYSVAPGERLVIEGRNLLPRGTEHPPKVQVAGITATVLDEGTNSRITAIVPPEVPIGSSQLTLTTTTRADAEPRSINIIKDEPMISSVQLRRRSGGHRIIVEGQRFVGALSPKPNWTELLIGGSSFQRKVTRRGELDRIESTLPRKTMKKNKQNDVDVVIRTFTGNESEPKQIDIPGSG